MWQMLEEGKSVGEARDAIFDEYEVERDRLEADLLALAANWPSANSSPSADG